MSVTLIKAVRGVQLCTSVTVQWCSWLSRLSHIVMVTGGPRFEPGLNHLLLSTALYGTLFDIYIEHCRGTAVNFEAGRLELSCIRPCFTNHRDHFFSDHRQDSSAFRPSHQFLRSRQESPRRTPRSKTWLHSGGHGDAQYTDPERSDQDHPCFGSVLSIYSPLQPIMA